MAPKQVQRLREQLSRLQKKLRSTNAHRGKARKRSRTLLTASHETVGAAVDRVAIRGKLRGVIRRAPKRQRAFKRLSRSMAELHSKAKAIGSGG